MNSPTDRSASAGSSPPGEAPAGFRPHDHRACVEAGLRHAEEACAARSARFTPVRRRVLEMLLESHAAVGAYELLDRLRAEGWSAQPPVAYRALDFLTEQGFVHRIEARNAFIACSHPGEPHHPAFLICRSCGTVAEEETSPAQSSLGRRARASGFRVERSVMEVEGLCPACAGDGETDGPCG